MVLKDIKREDTLFDLIPQAILIVIDKNVVYSNKRVKDILGWDRDELIGAHITKILPPGKELEYRDLVCQKMESSNICHLDVILAEMVDEFHPLLFPPYLFFSSFLSY